MKINPIFFLFFALFISESLLAQECHGFFPFEPDTKLEMTYYDKKGKTSSSSEMTILDIVEMDGIVEAHVASVLKDKKGEEVVSGDYRILCKENGYEVDVSNMVNPEMLQATHGMELDITGDALVFPKELTVGETLPDGYTTIEVRSNDMKIMTMTIEIVDRKVEAKESITTPAGTFECYKLSYQMNSKVAFMKKNYKTIQWIADGVGVVRDETYNKKDKLESYSELTKFEQ